MICKMAIIAEQHTLNSLEYAERGGEQLYTNNVFGSPKEIFNDFKLIQDLNDRAKNKSIHAILSFNPNDNMQKLTKQDLIDISNKYLEKHGFDDNQAAVYLHNDKAHIHLHIVANRIKMDGICVSTSNNYFKNLEFAKEMENQYQLIKTNRKEKGVDFVKDSQRANQIKAKIDKSLLKSTTMDEFCKHMKNMNVLVLRGRGIAFVDGSGAKFKGSELGREYSLVGIEKQINLSKSITNINQESGAKLTVEPKIESKNDLNNIPLDLYFNPKHFKSGEDEEEEDARFKKNNRRGLGRF